MGNLVFQATLGGQVNLVGPNTASTYNLNVPAISSTIATTSGTETLTNKTLTNPVINGFTGDTSVINVGSGQFYKDTSGNLGLGVTPSAWVSSAKAIEMPYGAFAVESNGYPSVLNNAYEYSVGAFKYRYSGLGASRYIQTFGSHGWSVAGSGTAGNAITWTAAMTLDASGNLGVGSTSPNIGGVNKAITLNSATSTNCSYELAVNGTLQGSLYTGVASSSLNLGTFVNGPLTFVTNSSERARIDSSGNLLVGTTSANGRIAAQSSTATSGSYAFFLTNSATTNMFYVRGDGVVMTGTAAGSPYNNTTASAANMYVDSGGVLARSTSSLKYKMDVQDATHGLAEVMQLRSVTYKGKKDGDTVFGGLIAEEVHDAGLTEFVQYADDGSPDALAYGNMVSLCIKAIQEQQAIIETLTSRIAALENK